MWSSSAEAVRNANPSVLWPRLRTRLKARGLWPVAEDAYEQVEERVSRALPPVEVSPQFRQALASNLDLLAAHRRAGVEIKPEPTISRGRLIGIGIASLVAAAGLVALIIYLATGLSHRPSEG